MTQPTDTEIQEILDRPAPAELTEGELALAKAQMNVEIGRQRAIIDRMTVEVDHLRDQLQGAGWASRFSDLELTEPGGKVKVQVNYTGGEFVANITGLLGGEVRTSFRITPALHERQPDCVDRLTRCLLAISGGLSYTIHIIAGPVAVGLEAGSVLFGERSVADDDHASRASGANI